MATGSSIALDPFAGTGGLLRPITEALGSPYVLGMDVVGGTCGTGRDMVAGNALRLPLRGEVSQSQNQTQSQTQNQMGVYDVIVCDPPYGMRAPRIEGASGEKDPVVAGPRAMEAATMDFIRPVVAFAGSSCGLVRFSLF
jgi:tRNA G10  N-methylase Trm11